MIEKLKPCPHCGGEAVFQNYHTVIDDKLFPNKDNSFWYVRCENCRAGSWYYATSWEAAAAWNTRDWLGSKLLRKFKQCVNWLAHKASEWSAS